MAKVRTIPATKILSHNDPHSLNKRRVAGYARVSTDSDEQFTSYQAQIDYYTSYIKSRPDWEFVKVYTDEGISGTSTNRRVGFNTMITDALAGNIDLIVTKSVSRFARNTVDSLVTIRKLKEKNIECFFEKENIWTFDGKGELLITIMSSIAQEESRSISENVTWSKRRQAKEGKVSLNYKHFLGYEKGPDGKLMVNEEQAEVVKLIYTLFLQGKSPNGISQILTERGTPSPAGKDKWSFSCVKSILQNEKYIGDALLQKSFTVDYLTHRIKKNEGEVPQYYVEENHEPIISKEVYQLAQIELERRKGLSGCRNRKRIMSGRIQCAQCGSWFGRKIWHQGEPGEKVLWQCNGKYDKSHETCTSGNYSEREIQQMFVVAVNELLKTSTNILDTQKLVYDSIFDTSIQEGKQATAQTEMDIVTELLNRMASEPREPDDTPIEEEAEYRELQQRYKKAKERKNELTKKIEDKEAKKAVATEFFNELKSRKDPITEFNPDLWNGLLDHIKIHSEEDIRFIFKDGSEVKVDRLEEEKKRPDLTERQKYKITTLRRDGITYKSISKQMDLPVSQIRSFCLSRTAPQNDKAGYCKTCGKKLSHTPGYKKKIFCSDGCRQDWWNRFGDLKYGKGRATFNIVCKHCGKEFITYGKNRKYCNREFYSKDKRANLARMKTKA